MVNGRVLKGNFLLFAHGKSFSILGDPRMFSTALFLHLVIRSFFGLLKSILLFGFISLLELSTFG